MKNFKRLLCALVAVVSICVLAGCSAAESDIDASDEIKDTLVSVAENLAEELGSMERGDFEEEIAYLKEAGDTVILPGLENWYSAIDDIGYYIGIESTTLREDEDNYYVDMVIAATVRNVEITVGIDKGMTGYERFTVSPVYTTGEKMAKAAKNLLIGMVTVFAVLILLMFIISGFKYIGKLEELAKNKFGKESKKATADVEVPSAKAHGPGTSDSELVAVITAAIAASAGTNADGLVVRSIKRASNSRWKR